MFAAVNELLDRVAASTSDSWSCERQKPGASRVARANGVALKMRFCPAGSFKMGANKKSAFSFLWPQGERRAVDVTLTRGFWMLETPVTQRMFAAIAGFNPSYFSPIGPGGDASPRKWSDSQGKGKVAGMDTGDFPVEAVNWFDCQKFVETLNAMKILPWGFAFRLPTSAEWEYACRAGTGDDFNFACSAEEGMWSCLNSDGRTRRVAEKSANAWGLYDMHGNVREWCFDWCEADAGSGRAIVNPMGAQIGTARATRGGAWNLAPEEGRAWREIGEAPARRLNNTGFRLVASAVVPQTPSAGTR